MLTLLYGENTVAIQSRLSEIVSGYSSTAVRKIEEKDLVYAQFESLVRAVSMFDDRMALVVYGKLDVKSCSLELLQDTSVQTDVIIVVYGDLSATHALRKEVTRLGGVIQHFEEEPEREIFGFLEAVAQRQRGMAMKLLHQLWSDEKDPIYIQSMLVWQYRAIMAPELQKGFVQQKSAKLRAAYSEEELFKIYRMLYQLEVRLKTGEGDPHALVEEFVLKVTQA